MPNSVTALVTTAAVAVLFAAAATAQSLRQI